MWRAGKKRARQDDVAVEIENCKGEAEVGPADTRVTVYNSAAMIIEALLAVLSLSTLTVGSEPSPWEVTSVPGLDQPVNFKHYSGFVDAGHGRRLHYW
ncbi:hypothetical protein HPB50_013350 [Hyalomma asiaticum]|uniref:Uncharacterized protein n=1 Tax=Hyalomma asiaticum TaxID=266040 RepID=A0ACB7T4B2_HYAAI|nr:hypothetical protein HPB50_013350 [Hyalomma asiaticum]